MVSWIKRLIKDLFLKIPNKPLDYYSKLPQAENVELPTEDGQTIWGLLIKPENVDSKTKFFIVCHGKGIDRVDAVTLARLRSHKDRNVCFLMIDYRGFGGSTGEFSVSDVNYDLDAAVEYLKSAFGAEKISIVGHSLGTGIAIEYCRYLAYKNSEFFPENVYCFASFTSLRDCLMNFRWYRVLVALFPPVKALLPGDFEYNSMANISYVHCKIYLFHGKNDPLIPFDHSERLWIFAKNSYLKITNDNHDTIFGNEECWKIIFGEVEEQL